MNAMELAAIGNFILALIGLFIYFRNAIRCKTPWKFIKIAIAVNLGIGVFIYTLIVLHKTYDPLIVRLNTSLLYIIFIIMGTLGRSKYGIRK